MDVCESDLAFLRDLPSFDRDNFSLFQRKDGRRVIIAPKLYTPTHEKAEPPVDQVIKTEKQNILLRHVYKQLELMNIRTLQRSEADSAKRPNADMAGEEDDSAQARENKRPHLDDGGGSPMVSW